MIRIFDALMSALGLAILSPLFLVAGLLIKWDDGGPVFFGQSRIGQNGVPFKMWKFRSMRVAKSNKSQLTIGNDDRITRVGRFLRAFKIDELPQLWNVLRGQMGLVGPRPEVEKYVSQYNEADREVLVLKPGITDPASFAFFDESDLLGKVPDPETYYMSVLVKEKIRINLEYARKRNLLTDIFLIMITIAKAFGVSIDVFTLFGIQKPKGFV